MDKPIIYFISLILLLFFIWLGLRWLIVKVSPPPTTLGATNGRFAPCPGTPNCVSSQEERVQFYTEPIPYLDSAPTTRATLLRIISEQPRMELVQDDGQYIHIVARTPFWGFIDDIQFQFNDEMQQVDIRSAARLGQGDLGVNAGYAALFREQLLKDK